MSFCDYIDGGGTREIVCAPERTGSRDFLLVSRHPENMKLLETRTEEDTTLLPTLIEPDEIDTNLFFIKTKAFLF